MLAKQIKKSWIALSNDPVFNNFIQHAAAKIIKQLGPERNSKLVSSGLQHSYQLSYEALAVDSRSIYCIY